MIWCLVVIIKSAFYSYVKNDLNSKMARKRGEKKYKRLAKNMNIEKITEESVEDEEQMF